ncbi:hypothetical protein [Meridianimarinicoccus roseus]|uniref:hypothetical protein n=1 Tax=Meridianimarinicoccus roseus TaxID=2072018 RepID=UPI0011B26857|nr:hypothetical protein [Meridianimarinicoccus roseus]
MNHEIAFWQVALPMRIRPKASENHCKFTTEGFGKPLQVATAVPAASERTGGYTADFSVLLPAGQVRFPPVGAQG